MVPFSGSDSASILERDFPTTFRRHLSDTADAPLSADAPASANAPLAADTLAVANAQADASDTKDDREFLGWLDFDSPLTIILIVLACLGAIVCSGMGCMCFSLCCTKPRKEKPKPGIKPPRPSDPPKATSPVKPPPVVRLTVRRMLPLTCFQQILPLSRYSA